MKCMKCDNLSLESMFSSFALVHFLLLFYDSFPFSSFFVGSFVIRFGFRVFAYSLFSA